MARLTPCPWIKVSSANITNQIYFKLLRRKNLFQNVEKEKSISKCWERSVKRKPSLSLSRVKKFVFWSTLGYSRKNPNREGGGERGGEDIEFPQRNWRKIMWKFQGSIKKEVEFPGMFKNNSYGISMDFLTLEIPRSVTDLAVFPVWKLVFPGISKGY